MSNTMRNLVIGLVILLMLFLGLPLIGVSTFLALDIIEWATKFIFPWIVLYWFIRLIKRLEKNNQNH